MKFAVIKVIVDLRVFSLDRQKQPPRGVLKKRCSENIPMLKCDFNNHTKFAAYFQNTFF